MKILPRGFHSLPLDRPISELVLSLYAELGKFSLAAYHCSDVFASLTGLASFCFFFISSRTSYPGHNSKLFKPLLDGVDVNFSQFVNSFDARRKRQTPVDIFSITPSL